MKRFHLLILSLFLFLVTPVSLAQESFRVSDPRLELKDNIIHITYDILNGDRPAKYAIDLVITDSNKNQIEASTLSGDIGENVIGGINRLIKWDLQADSIYMDAEITFKIHAKAMLTRDSETSAQGTSSELNIQDFSRTGIILNV